MVRKTVVVRLFLVLGLLSLAGLANADPMNHYINGIEGIKGGTLPPPGLYYRMYNAFYTANDLMDEDGDELNIDFDLDIYANVNRFIYVSQIELLGGNYFCDGLFALINTDLDIGALGLHDQQFGFYDLYLEPIGIAWHGDWWDAAVGASVFFPTGDFDKDEPASPGKGYYTGMFTAGGTVYFDKEKTWSLSILPRYEIHSDMEDFDRTPGDDLHLEWGIGKTLMKVVDVGVAGYCQWQVTEDRGDDADDVKDHVYAVGPEVDIAFPSIMLFLAMRGNWEFEAKDRPQGFIANITLTKRF